MQNDDQKISCPKCHTEIPLTEALSGKIKERLRAEYDIQMQRKNQEIADEKNKLKEEEIKIGEEKKRIKEKEESMNLIIDGRLKAEEIKIREAVISELQGKAEMEMQYLKEQNARREKELNEARRAELEWRKEKDDFEEKKKNYDLEFQRKLDAEKNIIVEKTKTEMANDMQMKMREKEKQMEMLQRTIEDLKRKSEQGSMQIQGEVQEEELRESLSQKFPQDMVEDVPTGIKGADLIQNVNTNFGEKCGIILWESKNTKMWSNDWIKKLKDDQIIAKADVCILVSRALPEGVKDFSFMSGVWVCDYRFVISLASVIRMHLKDIGKIKNSFIGRDEKMENLYNYFSGNQFKTRVENIVMAFSSMKNDLETEKRSMQRIWAKREKEIERVIDNTAGMYGELQGISGSALAPVKNLELPDGDVKVSEEESEAKDENALF
ncbi:MAG: DUF2130 domain-containing protein [bacterium]